MASTLEFPLTAAALLRNGNRSDLIDINQGLFRSVSVQSNLVQKSNLTPDRSLSSSRESGLEVKDARDAEKKPATRGRSKITLSSRALLQQNRNGSCGSLLGPFLCSLPSRQARGQSPLCSKPINGVTRTSEIVSASPDRCRTNGRHPTTTNFVVVKSCHDQQGQNGRICGNLTEKCRSLLRRSATPKRDNCVTTADKPPLAVGHVSGSEKKSLSSPVAVSARPISGEVLSEILTTKPSDVMVLDCRGFTAYNVNHIRGSLNVSCADCISRKRLLGGKATVADMIKGGEEARGDFKEMLNDKTIQLLVYDDNTKDFSALAETHPLRVVVSCLKRSGRNVYFLQGGLEAFCKDYPGLCTQCEGPKAPVTNGSSPPPTASDPNIDSAVISQILPELYLGNERDASDKKILLANGIRYILNVTSQIPLHFQSDGITYKRIPASDSGCQNLSQYFDEAVSFIDNARRRSGRVLVHCQAGVSRSATIAIAYVMKRLSLNMLDAFRYVKGKRAVVSPNFNFMGQLLEYEATLNNNCVSSKRELKKAE